MKKRTSSIERMLSNRFLNLTKSNYKLFNSLSTDHLTKLERWKDKDKAVEGLYKVYKPLDEVFRKALSTVPSVKAQYHHATRLVTNKQQEIYEATGHWRSIVESKLYGQPAYKAIFPNGRKPFASIGREQFLSALETLAKNLATFSSLKTLKDTVEAEAEAYAQLRKKQQKLEMALKEAKTRVRKAHQEAAHRMFVNSVLLLDIFRDVQTVANFYDSQLMGTKGKAKKVKEESEDVTTEEVAGTTTESTDMPATPEVIMDTTAVMVEEEVLEVS